MTSHSVLAIKRNLLLAAAGLSVAYVRNLLQYHSSWTSAGEFFGSWILHYFAVLLLVALSYGFISMTGRYFLETGSVTDRVTPDEAVVYVSIIVLVAAAIVLLTAYWPPADMYA